MKVKIDVKNLTQKIIQRFDKFSSSPVELKIASETILKNIKADSKKGIGFDGNQFPEIKESTINRRKVLEDLNPTDRFFKPRKSNATFMGDTIDGIVANVKENTIVLSGEGEHRPIFGARGFLLKGSDAPISSILKGLSEKGWKILGVSKRTTNAIRTQFIRFLRRKQ